MNVPWNKLRERSPDAAPEGGRGKEERGSAILIALLIMVVLSLLGVSFLVISDTENRISVNERNDQQILYVAEAGVGVVKSWFDQPDRSRNPLVPRENEVILNRRRGDVDLDDTVDLDGSAGDLYTGGSYEGITRLFEKPYRGRASNTFWGLPPDANGLGPDVVLTDNPNSSNDYIDKLNRLFNPANTPSLGAAKILQIRIFRPPVAKAMKIRLGIATIEVVAVRNDPSGRMLATRTVRDAIQEFPYPGPRGAIESAGTISLNGNFTPHWGFVESEDVIDFKEGKTFGGVPRDPDFPYGDDYRKFQDFNPKPYRDPHLRDNSGPTGVPDGDVTNHDVQSNVHTCGNAHLIEELVAKSRNAVPAAAGVHHWVQDPWLVYRTQKWFTDATGLEDMIQPWPWDPGRDIVASGSSGAFEFPAKNKLSGGLVCGEYGEASNMMQKQPVKFPVVLYEPWKQASLSDEDSVHYYRYTGVDGGEAAFQRDFKGESKAFKDWVNTEIDDNDKGLHFFDSVNSCNPQPEGRSDLQPGEDPRVRCPLTPRIKLQKGGMGGGGNGGGGGGGAFIAEGFLFTNAETIDSTGVAGGVDRYVNMPGEPFLDIGIDLDGDGEICAGSWCCLNDGSAVDRTRCNEWDTVNNNRWDVELDAGCNPAVSGVSCYSDGDDYVEHDDWDDFIAAHAYAPGDVPHSTDDPAYTKSEAPQFLHQVLDDIDAVQDWDSDMYYPHEPYLNLRYPPERGHTNATYSDSWNLVKYEVAVDYDAENNGLSRAVDTDELYPDDGDVDSATDRTTTGYDVAGSLFKLPLNLHGVFYNEGEWDGSGNLVGYGSLLMRDGFRGRGTIHMYFDESLVRGQWPPEEWELPRVFSSSSETETNMDLQQR